MALSVSTRRTCTPRAANQTRARVKNRRWCCLLDAMDLEVGQAGVNVGRGVDVVLTDLGLLVPVRDRHCYYAAAQVPSATWMHTSGAERDEAFSMISCTTATIESTPPANSPSHTTHRRRPRRDSHDSATSGYVSPSERC